MAEYFAVNIIRKINGNIIEEITDEFKINEKFLEQVKLELVRYELKSEGIDP